MAFFEQNLVTIIVLALITILALTSYAIILVVKLRKQQAQVKSIKDARLDNIWVSITTICDATLQQQCNISEAAVRIIGLLEASAELNQKFESELVTVSQFFKAIEHHPILQNRKSTAKPILEKLDAEREEMESLYETRILKELDWLRKQNI